MSVGVNLVKSHWDAEREREGKQIVWVGGVGGAVSCGVGVGFQPLAACARECGSVRRGRQCEAVRGRVRQPERGESVSGCVRPCVKALTEQPRSREEVRSNKEFGTKYLSLILLDQMGELGERNVLPER